MRFNIWCSKNRRTRHKERMLPLCKQRGVSLSGYNDKRGRCVAERMRTWPGHKECDTADHVTRKCWPRVGEKSEGWKLPLIHYRVTLTPKVCDTVPMLDRWQKGNFIVFLYGPLTLHSESQPLARVLPWKPNHSHFTQTSTTVSFEKKKKTHFQVKKKQMETHLCLYAHGSFLQMYSKPFYFEF